ncbi:hypothetical protein CPAR01_07639 [Colletotrichum paranaense]|uniref:Uncharacterized protein n=1 Tax=Colletotrichum paranaense TaxID=1914294 RepID=A0ABQ9SHZ0_9PEZI|nr:uncharacterized protein CPAR01_07639 [Colletotrichum paranaense]KAK1537526.1 hypothetical protein CPAR01_07639 [Colletotrichum paranaense]
MGDCALPSLPLYIRTSLGFTNWQANIPRARPDSKGECETCEFALRAHKTHIVRQVAHYASVSVPYTTVILIHTAHRPGPLAPVGSACGHWHLPSEMTAAHAIASSHSFSTWESVTAAHSADHLGYGYIYLTLL